MRRHVVGRHTDYLPDATALTGRRDQQYTSETTRARRRTWRNALVAYLLIRLWCFAAFDVPGQTAHVRGFTIREHQNSQENYPKIRELYSSHLIARLLENLSSALSRAFTAGQNIPKNRCRTTIAERMVETRAELPFIGDQVGLSRAQPGRPKRTCNPMVEDNSYGRPAAEGTAVSPHWRPRGGGRLLRAQQRSALLRRLDQRTRRPITGAAPQPRVRSRPSQGCSTAVPVRENRPQPAWLPPDRSHSGKPEKGRLVPLNVDPALQERPMRGLLAKTTSARAADDRSVRPS